jgi:hypothetical protein
MDNDTPGRKRVILSTSHPDQECVDIVLYRRDDGYGAGEERLGHVMLCDISPGTPEESEIELTIELEEDGGLEVSAIDRRSGNRRDVSIDRSEVVPRFDEEDAFTAGQVRELLDDDVLAPRRRSGFVGFVLALLLLLIVGGLVWWFFFATPRDRVNGVEETVSPAVPSATVPPETREPDTPIGTAGPEAMTGADATQSATGEGASAETSSPAGETTPTGDNTLADNNTRTGDTGSLEQYEIKWGDTLWDISSMFYGTPWRFPEIADENMIQNPDLIYADDEIRVPRR